jgi:flagellar assembly factor FliW
MLIETDRFGQVEIDSDDVITMVDGILGFEEVKRYVVINHRHDKDLFKWLQALDRSDLAFVVMRPEKVFGDYVLDMSPEDLKKLQVQDEKELIVYAITVIPHNNPMDITVNLKAPVVVNSRNRLADQVIVSTEGYTLRHRVFSEIEYQPDESGGKKTVMVMEREDKDVSAIQEAKREHNDR